jgi:hypothetical protein
MRLPVFCGWTLPAEAAALTAPAQPVQERARSSVRSAAVIFFVIVDHPFLSIACPVRSM